MKSVNLRDRIMNSPSTPFWVSNLIPVLEDKDPVDVLTYLNVLKTLWSEKVRELAETDVTLAWIGARYGTARVNFAKEEILTRATADVEALIKTNCDKWL